jgi:hypothetical protein
MIERMIGFDLRPTDGAVGPVHDPAGRAPIDPFGTGDSGRIGRQCRQGIPEGDALGGKEPG